MIIRILIVVSLLALGFVLFLLFSKRQKQWNEMDEQEQKKKKTLIAGGITVFLAGLIAALYLRKKE